MEGATNLAHSMTVIFSTIGAFRLREILTSLFYPAVTVWNAALLAPLAVALNRGGNRQMLGAEFRVAVSPHARLSVAHLPGRVAASAALRVRISA
jgi:hypothetical protein